MSAVIAVTGVTKTFETTPLWMRMLVRSSIAAPVTALENVTFSVDSGQILTVVGPNGAGKSTLFRILSGLTIPSSGTVRVAGLDPETKGPAVRRRIGFMPSDDRTLFLRHTCFENLDFHGRLQGMSAKRRRQRIDETLELVGLEQARDRAGFALSSGMKSRLLFARAIMHEPKVLILDEPTGPVDPIAAYELLEQIQKVSRHSNVTTILSSHRVEEIEALADNVMFLDQGRVAFLGDLEQVRKRIHQATIELEFDSSIATEEALVSLSNVPGSAIVDWSETTIRVRFDRGAGRLLMSLGRTLDSVTSVASVHPPFREVLRSLARAKHNGKLE